MAHYICEGTCKGVSETPGACNAEGCVKHQQPLSECDCTDGQHYGKQVHAEGGESGAASEMGNSSE